MKKIITAALSLLFAVCMSYTVIAGSIEPSGPPTAGSGMYTLQNLYDYLTIGTALTVQSGFQEPTSGPGSTMKTTKEIGDVIAGKFTLCNATAYDVALGKTFFCTQPGSWGVQTGKVCIAGTPTPTRTPTPTITPTPTATPWTLNQTTCDVLDGWAWINNACWSHTLVTGGVPWNRGVSGKTNCSSDDCSKNAGTYECNSTGTLQSRMQAAIAQNWSQIVTSVNGVSITADDNGSNGRSKISALAIADCIDGARDLGTADGVYCADVSDDVHINDCLMNWAIASGKSALPLPSTDSGHGGTTTNHYSAACTWWGAQSGQSGTDIDITQTGNDFWLNHQANGDIANWNWGAASGHASGQYWNTNARIMGLSSCSYMTCIGTSSTNGGNASFRVVVRP